MLLIRSVFDMTGYVEEVDSGMESVPDSSKDITPEKALAIDDNYDVGWHLLLCMYI